MTRGLFITGTGTGVGKTFVAALVARALAESGRRAGVYKPAASGCSKESGALDSNDAALLWEAAGRPGDLAHVCPQMFAAPLAPHLAARAEGRTLDASLLFTSLDYWKACSDIVLVEGAGGLLSPLGDDLYNADLAAEFGYPLVIVAANELGTINATLQTLVAARAFRQKLNVAGIVLNWASLRPDDSSTATNGAELARHCDVPLLAEVAHGGKLDRDVDWWTLAGD